MTRSSPGASSATRPGLLAAVAVGMLALLAVAVAAGGPVEFGPPRLPVSLAGPAEQLGNLGDVQTSGEEAAPGPGQQSETPWALIVLGLLTTALAALAIRSLRPPRVPPATVVAPSEQPPDLDTPDAAQLAALRRAAGSGRVRLARAAPGQARDAVVAAWLALEDAAAAGGTPRHPAQTPTEFTVAVLARHDADTAATTTLLRLYHRARFGRAPLPDDAADRAAEALGTITASVSGVRHG